MKVMQRVPTLFLKAVVILLSLPVLALCIFVVPALAGFVVKEYPEYAATSPLIYIDLYLAAMLFHIALYQAFKLLTYIDRNEAFSELSVAALGRIRLCGLGISALFVFALPLFYLVADSEDAPGIILIGMMIVFASLVIAVFAAVLEKLLRQAIDIKSENDLTV